LPDARSDGGPTDPVFVDRTGRRRRVATIAASVAGLVLVLVALAMFVGFTGVGAGHLPGLPGAVDPAATAAPAPGRSATPGQPEQTPRPSVTRDPALPTNPGASPSRSSNGHRPTHTPSHPGKTK
jgi:hypothetical protein